MSNVTNAASEKLISTIAVLPDQVLLEQTRMLARHEQALQLSVLDHLREIEARRLYLRLGYSSLFDYTVHELHYTEASAWRRIKAMRLCRETRGVREWLQDGSLNLSNAAVAELVRALGPQRSRSGRRRIAGSLNQRRAARRLGSLGGEGRGGGCALARVGCSRPAAAGGASGGQEHPAGATDAGRVGSRGGGARRAAARAWKRALGAEGGDRRRVPARTAAAAGAAVARGSAPDDRATRRAAGAGRSGALRSEPTAGPEAERVRSFGRGAFLGDGGAGDGRSRRRRGGEPAPGREFRGAHEIPFRTEAVREADGRRHFAGHLASRRRLGGRFAQETARAAAG